MKPYKKTLELDKQDYYEVHLNLVNSIARLGLTNREVEVLSAFMCLEGELADNMFSTLSRKKVKLKLDLSDAGLSNFLRSLSIKKCIIAVDDNLQIHPTLHPKESEQLYFFKLICK
jgi:hypothetical protein